MFRKMLSSLMILMLGAAIGAAFTSKLMPIADNCNIVYVAQDEIMELENARVKNDKLDERQLFYGEIERAVTLATELPKQYQNHTTKLVYSMNSVSGENVRSVSKEVHQEIIERLKEESKE